MARLFVTDDAEAVRVELTQDHETQAWSATRAGPRPVDTLNACLADAYSTADVIELAYAHADLYGKDPS